MRKFLSLIIAFFGLASFIRADIPTPEMSDISYDYNLTFSGSSYDSMGTLTLTVRVPENTKHIYFYNTTVRYRNVPKEKLFFSTLREFLPLPEPGQPKTYTASLIRSGIYFKLVCVDEYNNRVTSDTLCSSSYINPDDLDLILNNNAEIEEVDGYEPKLYKERGHLVVDSLEPLDLTIFTMDGKILYKNHDIVATEIDLRGISPQIVLVRYSTNDYTKTIKLLLK